jgi:hypothetical protein
VVLTVSFVLSPVIGLLVTVAGAIAEAIVARLNASVEASGPHDFAVRVTAHSSFAPLASIAPRAQRP